MFSVESMELANESMEISACADDFPLRSMELARFIDVFARYSIMETHHTVTRARSAIE